MKFSVSTIITFVFFIIVGSIMIYNGIQEGTSRKLVTIGFFMISIVFVIHFYLKYQANQIEQVYKPGVNNNPDFQNEKFLEFPQRFDFPQRYYFLALWGFIVFCFSILMLVVLFKWPELFTSIFKYRQVGIVFILTVVTGFWVVIIQRNQTGYIEYNASCFECKNRFFLGKSFIAEWKDLKEMILQKTGSSANIIFHFKGEFVAATDSSPEYKKFILHLLQFLETTAQNSKIRCELITPSIGSTVSPNLHIDKQQYINWLVSDSKSRQS